MRLSRKRTWTRISARGIRHKHRKRRKSVYGKIVNQSLPHVLYCSHCLRGFIDSSPKNPVVFCHGLLGFDTVTLGPAIAPLQVTHWRGIKDALEANGTEVLITRVPATSSPIDRAKVLEQRISEVYPGRSVHLIGTSHNLL
jgi:hypothetical protein